MPNVPLMKAPPGYSHRPGTVVLPVHIYRAEMALGRRLRKGEEVHHVDSDPTNPSSENLLICSRAYHKQLHVRECALYGVPFRVQQPRLQSDEYYRLSALSIATKLTITEVVRRETNPLWAERHKPVTTRKGASKS